MITWTPANRGGAADDTTQVVEMKDAAAEHWPRRLVSRGNIYDNKARNGQGAGDTPGIEMKDAPAGAGRQGAYNGKRLREPRPADKAVADCTQVIEMRMRRPSRWADALVSAGSLLIGQECRGHWRLYPHHRNRRTRGR